MFCPSCGSEITVELKYCNRCGANLTSLPPTANLGPPVKSVRLVVPTIVLGLIVTIGIGLIFSSVTELAQTGANPAFLTWMVVAGMATLFGFTALLLRFWMKVITLNREPSQQQIQMQPQAQIPPVRQQFPPRLEGVPSVTEHTTRTFSPVFREGSDPAAR